MALQQEAYNIVSAFQDNAIGGVLFVLLAGLAGMFILYILIPQFRNARVMGVILFMLLAVSLISALFVWPEFWDALSSDALPTLIVSGAALAGGMLFWPILIVLVIVIIGNVIGGRGLVGKG